MHFTPPDLIIGYLNKSLDKDGIEEFYNWIVADPENKKLFFEVKTVFDACSVNNTAIDIDKSWRRLLSKKQISPTPVYNLWVNICRYAAVASVAIAFTTAFFMFQKDDTPQPVPQYITGDGLEADAIILPDGTKVSIGSKTTFKYSPDYNKKNRVVYLEGEALFEVASNKDKPFIVKIKGQDIEALGTKFNVMAYTADSIFATTLLEGSVRLTTQNTLNTTILKPNQQFTYNINNQATSVSDVDASLYTSWVGGYYYFPDQTFQTILARLSNIYGVKFDIQSEKLKNKRFTGTFYRGESIKDILEIIKISIPINYKIEEDHVVIK